MKTKEVLEWAQGVPSCMDDPPHEPCDHTEYQAMAAKIARAMRAYEILQSYGQDAGDMSGFALDVLAAAEGGDNE